MAKKTTETQQECIVREQIERRAPKTTLTRTVETKAVKNSRSTMTGEWRAPKGATESGMLRMVVMFFLVVVVVVVIALVLNELLPKI